MKKPKSNKIALSTSYADVYLEDGIYHHILKQDRQNTIEAIDNHSNQMIALYGEKMPALSIIIDNTKGVKATKEFRDYAAKSESMQNIFAVAAIVLNNSPLKRIAGNLFLKFSKPAYTTRIFDTIEEAKKWLEQYKD